MHLPRGGATLSKRITRILSKRIARHSLTTCSFEEGEFEEEEGEY